LAPSFVLFIQWSGLDTLLTEKPVLQENTNSCVVGSSCLSSSSACTDHSDEKPGDCCCLVQ